MKRTLITNGKLLASSLVIAMAFSSTAMAQAKSTSTTPQTDVDNVQPNAISYGSTRSNQSMPNIVAPAANIPPAKPGCPDAFAACDSDAAQIKGLGKTSYIEIDKKK